ncbi:MAG: dolichol kinase [Bacteriovoracaceae bacterium]|jgi:dolichol kinase
MQLSSDTSTLDSKSLRARHDLHLLRKFWHMGTGLTGLFIYSYSGLEAQSMALILFGISVIGFLFEFIRLRNPAINKLAITMMGPFMRESEKDSLSGLPFYALGVSISLYFFDEKIAILGILFLIFSDPISSAIGILFGKDKILGGKKSIQGAAAGFVTCYMLALFYTLNFVPLTYSLLGFALAAGIIGSISELLSIFVDDNLTVPIISTLGLTVLNFGFGLY